MHTVHRWWKLTLAIVAMVIVGMSVSKVSSNTSELRKPNIIIILADDAGYSDFGFIGCKDVKTPNLDKLAEDGVVFTDAHVTASVCSPSRAGLLTGRYQQRFGHECNLEPNQSLAFDSAQITIAEYLRTKDYQTSIFGKWHLGEDQHQHPLKNGFEYFWGFVSGGRSYFPDQKQDQEGNSHAIIENYEHQNFEGYLTDVLGEKAKTYIENRQREKPFFMYLSFNAPHTPMHAKPEVVNSFGENHERPVYAAMMWSMDEAIGQVLDVLKQEEIYDNTLIFFLSDNGGAHNNNSTVKPFKGWKGNQYEGGTRVPFVMTWPDQITGGDKFTSLSSSLDIFGTVKALFSDDEDETPELDGVDLIPFLKREKSGSPHETLFWRKDEMSTVRHQNFKYINLKDSLRVLYDLSNDSSEQIDISKTSIEIVNDLDNRLKTWQKLLTDPIWLEPQNWNKVTEMIYLDLMNNNEPIVKDPGDLRKLNNEKSN